MEAMTQKRRFIYRMGVHFKSSRGRGAEVRTPRRLT